MYNLLARRLNLEGKVSFQFVFLTLWSLLNIFNAFSSLGASKTKKLFEKIYFQLLTFNGLLLFCTPTRFNRFKLSSHVRFLICIIHIVWTLYTNYRPSVRKGSSDVIICSSRNSSALLLYENHDHVKISYPNEVSFATHLTSIGILVSELLGSLNSIR